MVLFNLKNVGTRVQFVILFFIILTSAFLFLASSTELFATLVNASSRTCNPNRQHSLKQYHGLFDERLGCRHAHEHGDDPSAAESVLGEFTGDYLNIAGGQISYPWETHQENLNKHAFYKWIVLTDLPCEPIASWHRCFSDIALQVHFDGNSGNTTRFHSFALMASAVHDNGSRGYILTAGHYDTCCLRVGSLDVPLADDSFQNPIGCQQGGCGLRIHQQAEPVSELNRLPNDITWLGRTRRALVGIISHDAFGPTDPNDPSRVIFSCPLFDCEYNSSNRAIYQLHLNSLIATDGDQERFDPDGNGWVEEYRGWTNRYGDPAEGCSEPSPDCVPFWIVNWPLTSHFSYSQPGGLHTEHDISPDGRWWIKYPN